MIKIEINNQTVEAKAGERLLDVADREKINIPRFCYHKKLSVAANCRMCLVKVEGAPKLMPACTTYLTEGMRVSTVSQEVKEAQKSVMEFLLINHPLDCPVCDQGGECELQDVSMEFGYASSRFTEEKRSFINPDIGPLISTELNRCIQCSRCVRFGQEIAGVMELGLLGRGMHTSINTFLNRSMDSEISGNVIDLCPVGALTHKPSRFSARSWEMKQRPFIAMNDSLGSNAIAHIHDGKVFRVTPRENETLNETWLSDIDRYSYQGNNLERVAEPMIKENGVFKKVSWQQALEFATVSLAKNHPSLEVIINKSQSAEAHFMANKFSNKLKLSEVKINCKGTTGLLNPSENQTLTSLSNFSQYVLIGTQLRHKEPLINLAVRKAVQNGANVFALENAQTDFAYTVNDFDSTQIKQKIVPSHLFLFELKNAISNGNNDAIQLIKKPKEDKKVLMIIGPDAKLSPNFAALKAYLNKLAQDNQLIQILYLDDGSNANISNQLQTQGNMNFSSDVKSYLLIDVEPKIDLDNSALAIEKLKNANFVVSISQHQNEDILSVSDVILPLASHFESGGSHLNFMNQIQSFDAAIKPMALSKPAWKILTVLLEFMLMELGQSNEKNIEYFSLDEITLAVKEKLSNSSENLSTQSSLFKETDISNDAIIYLAKQGSSQRNSLLRRASAIQKTLWAKREQSIRLHPKTAEKLALVNGMTDIYFKDQLYGIAQLVIEEAIAENLVLIPKEKCPIDYGIDGKDELSIKNTVNSDNKGQELSEQTIAGD